MITQQNQRQFTFAILTMGGGAGKTWTGQSSRKHMPAGPRCEPHQPHTSETADESSKSQSSAGAAFVGPLASIHPEGGAK